MLGERDARDLVAHAAELDRDFRSLHSYVEDLGAGLEARLGTVEERLDGAVAHHGLVRYDAYNEMSGRQSTSIALLDARGSGVVVSSIHHRDQARLYAKQVVEGRGTLELSPEEQEAIRVALAREVPDRAEQRALMRLGYLGPAGTFSEEALRAATAPRARPASSSRSHRSTRRSWPCRAARSTARSCRSRTRSRAR